MVEDADLSSASAAATASSSLAQPQPSTKTAKSAPGKRRRDTTLPSNCCRTCRARKVKCTGNPGNGPCSNCARLKLACSFTLGDGSQAQGSIARTVPSRSYTEAGTLRKRAQRACQQCHLHKTKCSGDLPQCKRCISLNLVCNYVPAKRKYSNIPHQTIKIEKDDTPPKPSSSVRSQSHEDPSPSNATQDSDRDSVSDESESENFIAEKSLLNYQIIRSHLDAWFEVLHPIQCYGFLHSETTFKDAEEQKFSSILSAGICAATALYISPNPAGREFAKRCNIWVKFHISRTAGTLTKDRLTLLVLSSIYDLIIGDWPRVWEYCSTASRIVTALQSNWDATTGTYSEREGSRRLTWQVYCIDRILAGGFDEHLTLREEYLRLSLPCSEHAFRNNQRVAAARIDEPPLGAHGQTEPSLGAYVVRIMSLRHSVLGTTKGYALSPSMRRTMGTIDPFTVMGDVKRLQLQINVLVASLPASMQLSEANLQTYFGTPEWPAFIMIHTWVYQLYFDLYRFSVPGHREAATWEILSTLTPDYVQECQYQAVAAAITMARLWETCQGMMTRRPRGVAKVIAADHAMPVCIIQNIKVMLITRKHQFFFDLAACSTVPVFRAEAVDDVVLARLVDSNMALLESYQLVMPKVGNMARDIREAVANYRSDEQQIDKTESLIGMPCAPPLEEIRLPGPHYLLENAHVDQKVDDEANRQRSASLADKYLKKKASSTPDAVSPPTATVNTPPGQHAAPPDMPALLTHARAAMAAIPETAPASYDNPHNQQATYEFDMTGIIANMPNYPLMPSQSHGLSMVAPFDTTNTNPFSISDISPQDQFIIAYEQSQIPAPIYDPMQQDQTVHQYDIPYRGYN